MMFQVDHWSSILETYIRLVQRFPDIEWSIFIAQINSLVQRGLLRQKKMTDIQAMVNLLQNGIEYKGDFVMMLVKPTIRYPTLFWTWVHEKPFELFMHTFEDFFFR
jgi:hypothetical protein